MEEPSSMHQPTGNAASNAEAQGQTLKDKTAKGLFWGGLSNTMLQVLNLAFGIVLARLLSPSDYGMVGMLQVFSLLAIALQESGLNIALINKRDLRHEDVNAVFWFSLSTSIGLYIILFFCAPLIARFYHQPELTALARYSFLAFVASSLGICHNAVMVRQLRVKQNAIIQMSSLVVSGTVGVLMAWRGMAYWGLATQNLVYIIGVAAGRWAVSGWRPTIFSRYEELIFRGARSGERGARIPSKPGHPRTLRAENYSRSPLPAPRSSNAAPRTSLHAPRISDLAPRSSLLAPRIKKTFAPLRKLLPFSLKIMAANIITIINNNILTVILGRFYNEQEVGYYNQANKWNQMGYSIIQGMVASVAQPVLRQVADEPERQLRVFRKMMRFAAFVSFPCLFGLALVAPELITIAITAKWAASAKLMQMVCIGGAFLPIQNLMYYLLVSKGRSDLCLRNTIVFGLVQIAAMLLCRHEGITTMVWAFVGINIGWLLVWWWLVWQQIRLSLWHLLADILPFACIAAASILAALWASAFFPSVYLSLAVKVVVAVALYVSAMALMRVQTFTEALHYLRKK